MATQELQTEVLSALAKAMTSVRLDSGVIHNSWSEISQDMQRVAEGASKGFAGVLNRLTGLTPRLTGFSDAMRSALNPATDMKAMETALAVSKSGLQGHEAALMALEAARTKALKRKGASKTGRAAKAYKAQHAALAASVRLETASVISKSASLALVTQVNQQLSGMAGVLLPAVISGFKEVWQTTSEISRSFKEATTDGWERYQLLRESLQVQRETGASTEDVGKAMTALVAHGYDLKDGLGDVGKVVVEMELGLGVSADKGAELASSFRNLGQPVRDAADGIARLQRDTALSAANATQYYTQIARAMSLLKPGSGGMASQVAELVGQFEGASQKVIGRSGDLTKLITEMSGMEGMGTAAQLGMDPDFMADPAKVTEALNRLNAQVNNRLAGSSGIGRVALLESLSVQYGIQKDVLGNLNKIVEERNNQTLSQTTLEKTYNEQMAATNKSFAQITNIAKSVMTEALAPFIVVLAQFANAVRWLLDAVVNLSLFGFKPFAVMLSGAVLVGVVLATAQMYRLAKALYAVAVAGKAAEVRTAMSKAGSLSDMFSWNRVKALGRLARRRLAPARSMLSAGRTALSTRAGWSAIGQTLKSAIGIKPPVGFMNSVRGVAGLGGAALVGIVSAALIGIAAGTALDRMATEARANNLKTGAHSNIFLRAVMRLQDAAEFLGSEKVVHEDPKLSVDKRADSLNAIRAVAMSNSSPEEIKREIIRHASKQGAGQGLSRNVTDEMQKRYMVDAAQTLTEVQRYKENGMLTEKTPAEMESLKVFSALLAEVKVGGAFEKSVSARRESLEVKLAGAREASRRRDEVNRLLEERTVRNTNAW